MVYQRLCGAEKAKKVAFIACMRKLLTTLNTMLTHRTCCVKFLSLDLGSAANLRRLEPSDHKTRGPGAMVLSHLHRVLCCAAMLGCRF
jgi:hypothetical protein